MLKVRMRQFQKTIGDQRKKKSDLETTVSAAAAKGMDPKSPAPAPTTQAAKPADTEGPIGKKANETKDEAKVQAVAIKPEEPTSSVKVTAKDVLKGVLKDAARIFLRTLQRRVCQVCLLAHSNSVQALVISERRLVTWR